MQGIVNHCPSNEWTNRFGNFETVFNYTSRNNRITFGNGDKSCNKSTIDGLRFFFFFFNKVKGSMEDDRDNGQNLFILSSGKSTPAPVKRP